MAKKKQGRKPKAISVRYSTRRETPTEHRKRKKRTKVAGSAIYGTAGAGIGALYKKSRGKAAVVGGAVGAGIGYLRGKATSKKRKRVLQAKVRRHY